MARFRKYFAVPAVGGLSAVAVVYLLNVHGIASTVVVAMAVGCLVGIMLCDGR